MNPPALDYSIYKKLDFKISPVGVKFLFNKPENIVSLGKNIAFCDMLKDAQMSEIPFFVEPSNQSCKPGSYVWGTGSEKVYESGLFGVGLKVFKEAYADIRTHEHVRPLDAGVVRYIAFSPLDTLPFDPDLLVLFTNDVSQTEIILRAMSYTTGEMWSSKMTFVMGCAWIFAYPFITGKVNFITTGLSVGMKTRKVFPEGRQLISIPFNWLPTVTRNLREMEWVLPAYVTEDLREFVGKIYEDLGLTPS